MPLYFYAWVARWSPAIWPMKRPCIKSKSEVEMWHVYALKVVWHVALPWITKRLCVKLLVCRRVIFPSYVNHLHELLINFAQFFCYCCCCCRRIYQTLAEIRNGKHIFESMSLTNSLQGITFVERQVFAAVGCSYIKLMKLVNAYVIIT